MLETIDTEEARDLFKTQVGGGGLFFDISPFTNPDGIDFVGSKVTLTDIVLTSVCKLPEDKEEDPPTDTDPPPDGNGGE